MKKIFCLMVVVILAFSLIGCAVNTSTGIITVENRTNTIFSNIMVGQDLISLSLLPGQKYDFYYFKTITGKLTTSGVSVDNNIYYDLNGSNTKNSGEGIGELNFSLKTNYWIKIYAYYSSGLSKNVVNMSVSKQDGAILSYSEYIDY